MCSCVSEKSRAALERLVDIGQGDTGQSRIVANFLLAWWNAGECGGFDLTDVWAVDTAIAVDMLRMFALVVGGQQYPDAMGYGRQFEAHRAGMACQLCGRSSRKLEAAARSQKVNAVLDTDEYETAIKVSNERLAESCFSSSLRVGSI
jgi:hypothetical protein